MSNSDLDECVNCGAGLIKVSDICPQCGWKKIKPIEPNISKENSENAIENDSPAQEPAIIKNKILRPTGVKFISISYMIFGISLMLFGIIFVSAVMFLVMSDVMGELGGIGGGVGNMPMLPGMGSMDASTKSSLDSIIDLNRMVGSPSANEIEMRMSSSGIMNIDVMMEILGEASVIALIEIIVGLVIFVVGICLAKGKKLARPVTIISSIISIPLVLAFVTADTLVLLGMVAFNGIIIYYMLKSKARDYFNQTSTKKSEIKTDKPRTIVKQTIETSSVPDTPSGTKGLGFSSTKVRPLGVMILVILQVVSGIHLIVGAADIIEITASTNDLIDSIGGGSSGFSMFTMSTIFFQIISTIFITFGIASFVMALGLFKAKSWAWTLTCFFAIITLVLGVISMNIVIIILDVILLYYLYRSNVKDYFGKSAQQF